MNEIRGVILAGGTGSRLMPLTKVTNKHLLPVGNKPMILHPVQYLTDAGIHDIMIITGVEHMGAMVNLLGSGREYNCRFTYRVQDEAGGIAQALGLCRDFVGNNRCLVALGDNIINTGLKSQVARYREQSEGAMVLLKRVPDPERYGVAELSPDESRIISIEEKPRHPKTDLAVTGFYFYDANVFHIIDSLKPSRRGELEITDVNNAYLQRGKLAWDEIEGEWTDAGTFPSWHKANEITVVRGD